MQSGRSGWALRGQSGLAFHFFTAHLGPIRMIWLASTLKLLTEIALMSLLGRAVLGLLVGANAPQNFFWRVLDSVVQPVLGATARLARGRWPPARVTAAAALLLLMVWILATAAKLAACLSAGPGACR
jgi:hypothetical protein